MVEVEVHVSSKSSCISRVRVALIFTAELCGLLQEMLPPKVAFYFFLKHSHIKAHMSTTHNNSH